MNRKGNIDGKICDIINIEDFTKNQNLYNNKFTAIEEGSFVYPVRKKTDTKPGFYPKGPVGFFVHPSEEDATSYSPTNIINFESVTDMKDLIDKSTILRNMEKEVLTNPDNIFTPRIDEDDAPEMKALKQAVINKHMDLDKYEHRFDDNYNNDKRLFNKGQITMNKMKSICKAIDIKATLILEDISPDVPNPMGEKVIVELTGGEDNE